MFSAGERVMDTERNFGKGKVVSIQQETIYDIFQVEVEFNDPRVGTQWYTMSGAFYRSSAPTLRHY